MTTNSPNRDVQALIERLNRLAERLKWHNVGYAQDILKAVDLLTTPPAQLLRPVELPEPYDDGHGNLWLPQDSVISAIKKAGQVEGVSSFPENLADHHEVAKLRDRSFVDGLKSGFSMGQMQDETKFKETVERYLSGMREVKND